MDRYISNDIDSKGYGTVAKIPMLDKRLSIEAKAIYAFIRSYSGSGDSAFPSVKFIIDRLGIGKDRFYKHRKELITYGYLKIVHRYDGKRNESNIYYTPKTLNCDIPYFEDSQNEDPHFEDSQNEETISNSSSLLTASINNKNNNNDDDGEQKVIQFYENNFGLISSYIGEQIHSWIADIDSESIIYAMKIALERNKRSWGYVLSILKDWFNHKIKSVSDAKSYETERENKRKSNVIKYPKRGAKREQYTGADYQYEQVKLPF